MSLTALTRRLEKATDYITRHYTTGEPPELSSGFDLEMFTPDEQDRLGAFFAQIEPKLTWFQGTYYWIPGITKLSDQEHDHFESWMTLQRAMNEGDDALAERTRRYLTLSPSEKERIRDAVLALDERGLPEVSHCLEAPCLVWERTTYYLSRASLRNAKDRIRQDIRLGNYIRRYEIDGYWMWLEVMGWPPCPNPSSDALLLV